MTFRRTLKESTGMTFTETFILDQYDLELEAQSMKKEILITIREDSLCLNTLLGWAI